MGIGALFVYNLLSIISWLLHIVILKLLHNYAYADAKLIPKGMIT